MRQQCKKKTQLLYKKLCNLQYAITYLFWKAAVYFLYNWFISFLFCV